MLSVITGKQRAGKTFYCVTLIRDYLKTSQRNIYTNLPLHPDYLCRLYAGKSPAKYQSFLRRIYIFKKFRNLKEARYFVRKNPDWCKLRQLLTLSKLRSFWNYTSANSVIFLDELYQFFSSEDYKRVDLVAQRSELLTYSRQHGHFKDDLFLISHSLDDLDVHIRRGTQYLYEVHNSKYTNVFQWRWMRGFKWPVQFFIIYGFEYGETVPSDCWHVWTDKYVFKCYDSFSHAEKLGKSVAVFEAESSDTGVNFWWNLRRFFAQGWVGLAVLGGIVVGGFVGVRALRSLTSVTSKDVAEKRAGGVKSEVASDVKDAVSDPSVVEAKAKTDSADAVVEEKVKPVVTAVMSNYVYWSDGFKLRVGDDYKGLTVKKIEKSRVVFDVPGRGLIGCAISGVRD